MAKNIILLSDGTGNAPAKVWRTNVWRTFETLDLAKPDQVALYADGVGSSSFKPLAILGGVFGYGLKNNVLALYKFACRHYQPPPADVDAPRKRQGDAIYAFGFSRGAFTIRVLSGLIATEGLIVCKDAAGNQMPEADLDAYAKQAYRSYRAKRYHTVFRLEKPFRYLRDKFLGPFGPSKPPQTVSAPIRFLGLWDTVAAYGGPIEEMTIGFSRWVWPLEVPDRDMSGTIEKACHALSIDDDRTSFHPVLWNEKGINRVAAPGNDIHSTRDERLSQVWFAGVHSNVGGGYPDDRLAHVPLLWILEEAKACGLRFKSSDLPAQPPQQAANKPGQPIASADPFHAFRQTADADGRMYDPRSGLGGSYRYGPRDIDKLSNAEVLTNSGTAPVAIALPKIHHSVLDRINRGNAYAPVGLPRNYAIVGPDHGIIRPDSEIHPEQDRQERADNQWQAWDEIWKRRVWYFASVIVAFVLFLFPFVFTFDNNDEYESRFRPVSEVVRLAGSVLPGLFDPWITAYAKRADLFFYLCLAMFGLIWFGVRQQGKVKRKMANLWNGMDRLTGPPSSWIYKLRTSALYQWVLRTMKWTVAPFVLAIFMLYAAFGVTSHLVSHATDAAGWVCKEGTRATSTLSRGMEETMIMPSSDPCFATGITVREGERYRITIVTDAGWIDDTIPSRADGFQILEAPRWTTRPVMLLGVPLRRVLMRRYWMPIARVGGKGVDEYFLDDKARTLETLSTSDNDFRARRDGELFLYVNDAVFPFWPSLFYGNNKGTASITIRRL